MSEDEKNEYIDIHKMSEDFFEKYLYDMPRWAQSIFDCVMEHGDQCDLIDLYAFFNNMYKLTDIYDYRLLGKNYLEKKNKK